MVSSKFQLQSDEIDDWWWNIVVHVHSNKGTSPLEHTTP